MADPLILTRTTTFIIGPVADLLGLLMNGIFHVLNLIGIPNIGLAIILFTIVIYMALMPLTVKQQKFSKLSQKMQPELQAIQNKYKNKRDNDSMMKMNEETQAVYKKYGVSPTGSCVQLAIQMPILFALYRVIYNVPAYVTQVKDAFLSNGLIEKLIATKGASEYLQSTSAAAQFAKQFTSDNFINNVGNTVQNTFIDVLNRFSTGDWANLVAKYPDLSNLIHNTAGNGTLDLLEKYNNFLGLNIGNSPWYSFRQALAAGSVIGLIAAVLVPALAAITQLVNVWLMPQPQANSGNDTADQMTASMKTMNYIMPIMSAWFCFTLPSGMGLYWIAGSVIRSIQQVAINKSIDKMDMDAYVKQQQEKARKKAEKRGDKPTAYDRMMQYSQMSTKSLDSAAKKSTVSEKQKEQDLARAKKYYDNGRYKKGSLASRANMVRDFNDVNKN